jgi:hypothetical protein
MVSILDLVLYAMLRFQMKFIKTSGEPVKSHSCGTGEVPLEIVKLMLLLKFNH